MENNELKKVIESLLFASDKPLSVKDLKSILTGEFGTTSNLEKVLDELKSEYATLDKPYEIKFIAEGWTFATKAEYGMWIKKMLKEKAVLKLSPSALDTLAIIAYKQPVTRAEIDAIRGVDSSSGVMETLLERKLIKVVGRRETLGKPQIYGTTQEFLKHFGIAHLSELPAIDASLLNFEQPAQKEAKTELLFAQNEDKNSEKIHKIDDSKEAIDEISKIQTNQTKSEEEVVFQQMQPGASAGIDNSGQNDSLQLLENNEDND
ncbi:MAG: SMC-Scp complex subunit ScpB [Elusimicrobiota bacterium]|jgi:segregation and condensation protein B|nr:SMC-Scp complex subunit ScpB [Elusimicrobiota bacterium]